MKRLVLHALLALTLIVVAGLIFFFSKSYKTQTQLTSLEDQKTESRYLKKSTVYLYFAAKEDSFLSAEKRSLLYSGDPLEFGRRIIEALIQGPQDDLISPIPEGTKLRAFYITREGTAFVDLTAEVFYNHPGGITSELLTLFSIVNSLVLNIAAIDNVKILVEGQEPMTLAGHIDLRIPFKANILLVR